MTPVQKFPFFADPHIICFFGIGVKFDPPPNYGDTKQTTNKSVTHMTRDPIKMHNNRNGAGMGSFKSRLKLLAGQTRNG